jgi:hypothetical protein
LPSAADAFFYPSNLVDHEAETIMCFTFSARNTVLDGTCALLELGEYKDLNLEIHVGRRSYRSGWELRENVFSIGWVVGRSDAGVEHSNIDSIIPLTTNPSRMNSGSDRVRVIPIYPCPPEMPLQHDVLALSWFQVVPRHSDGEGAVDWIDFEAWEPLRF